MDTQNPSYEELKKLMEEKDSLVKEGKYLEAEEIRKKILSIKNDSSSQKKGSLHSLQLKQRQTLEDEYKSERKELEEKWDKKIQEFVELGKKQEKELVELHNKKMEEYITKATAEYPHIKYSTEYLNGKVQDEAAQRKALNDKLQTKENEKYEADRSENINKSAEILGLKQEQDLNVLRARLARIYDLMTSKKEKELETLDNKFKNKKQELIGNQMRQINITENANKDRAMEGSNKLIKMALKNKKENETLEKGN